MALLSNGRPEPSSEPHLFATTQELAAAGLIEFAPPRRARTSSRHALERYPPVAVAESRGGHRHVVRGSMWFIAAVGTGAAFSLLFWWMAARLAPLESVGIATGLWTNVQFINYITGMGLPIAVARYGASNRPSVHPLFVWALIYSALTSILGVVAFVAVAEHVVPTNNLESLWQSGTFTGIILLSVLIVGMAYSLLVEVRLVTLRKWRWVFGRVLLISVIRLPFLFVPAIAQNPLWLLILIAGTPALSGFIGSVGIWMTTPHNRRGPMLPFPAETMPAFRYASANYLGMLAAQAPQFALPILVNLYVNPSEFAPFFLAWSMTVVVFLIPHTIGQVVLAEGSRNVGTMGNQVRLGLMLSLGLMVAATLTAFLGSGLVTLAFGSDYEPAAVLLPRFIAAGIPWAVTSICLAKARVEGNQSRTVAITVGFAIFTLVPAGILSSLSGTSGAATAWLIGNVAAAVLAVIVTRQANVESRADLVVSAARAGAA